MQIVIIGNGIAGITAALTIRKLSTHEITVISGENPHFYARTALMYLYLGQLKYEHIKGYEDWFWQENNINLKQAWANAIDSGQKTVQLQTGETLPYDKLILATGSKTNFQQWPGQELSCVCGFYNLQDLALIEQHTRNCREAVIVGGGLIGVELAEMLHSRGIKTTILVRDEHYWGKNIPAEEAQLIEKAIRKNGIGIRFKTTLRQIEGNAQNQVQAIVTSENETLACSFVGIATGVLPNTELAQIAGLKTNIGIAVDPFLETSEPNVYAIGDCAELMFEQPKIEQLWYTGRLQGETVAHTVCGHKNAYRRGIPFNSAKFFDLEFQSYGLVNPESERGIGTFFWQHPQKNSSVRLNFVQETGTICGFVLLGIRFRQATCETWIKENRPLDYVLTNLEQAFFDAEFAPDHKNAILKHYKTHFPAYEINKPKRRIFWF